MPTTILLVEDELLLREMTKEDLEDLGYTTLCASDFEQAWKALSSPEKIDVLVTDIRMPGEADGWELARRAREARPGLGIIYISGYSSEQPQPVPGAVFVRKPYRLHEIERALAGLGAG